MLANLPAFFQPVIVNSKAFQNQLVVGDVVFSREVPSVDFPYCAACRFILLLQRPLPYPGCGGRLQIEVPEDDPEG
jgi:hypothetical protein